MGICRGGLECKIEFHDKTTQRKKKDYISVIRETYASNTFCQGDDEGA
jgi:hypothetical protein